MSNKAALMYRVVYVLLGRPAAQLSANLGVLNIVHVLARLLNYSVCIEWSQSCVYAGMPAAHLSA